MALASHWKISASPLLIVRTLFQIVSSIEAMLRLRFPPPFNYVLDLLSFLQLDILHVPVACVAEFHFVQKLLFSTLTPICEPTTHVN